TLDNTQGTVVVMSVDSPEPRQRTVAELLARLRQPPRLVNRLWAPLCIGALNTLPDAACAQAFTVVLRDTLAAGRQDADFVTSDASLGQLVPDPALRRLRELGAKLRLRSSVREIRRVPGGGWVLRASGGDVGAAAGKAEDTSGQADATAASAPFAAVLLALPPWSALRLLAPLGL
ncbi:MAG TPA: hypothetical protein PK177_13380, partial [Burkholderiaceae bacterium]|nr:hypothetical protein [Burkholderiaceae bacterium]